MILELNKKMIETNQYNEADMRAMQQINTLKNPNDYDKYLIVCALCNYNLKEKNQLLEKRMELYLKTNNGNIKGYEHKPEDYDKTKAQYSTICKYTEHINNYGLYEYEITANTNRLTGDLWSYKSKDCLRYVDNRTYKDKIIVSIKREQLKNFIVMLDELNIGYQEDNLKKDMVYNNKSTNKLIDTDKLSLSFTPYTFQIEDAKKIIQMKRCLIGHEMGCGKTFISILVGESIPNTPKLVICPESLRLNWKKEILNVNPNADISILFSNESPHFGKDWTIVGYKTATKFKTNLLQFDCVFIDEVQNCKAVNNWGKPSSQRATSILEIADKATYCYLLSGTPMPSHNKDLFNILKMLKCEEFDFKTQWAFKNYADTYCDPKETRFGMDYTGNSNSTKLHNILNKIMVRRLKKEVLPNLTKLRQFIPIEPKFKKDYKSILQRLQYPSPNDTYMGLAMTGRQVLSKYKIDTAIDLTDSLLNNDESVVLVTNFNETADLLKAKYKDKACEIRGGMTDDEKQKSIEEFQSKKKPICILNMVAGGVGITLTASHSMIILDYAWLPSDMIQVEDRICRSGQDKLCNIYYIYCENSVLDTIFIDMISNKSSNIDLVVDNTNATFDLNEEKDKSSTYLDKLKSTIKVKDKESA